MFRCYVFHRSALLFSKAFGSWERANAMLESLLETGAFSGGGIEQFVAGLADPDVVGGSWVLCDEEPETVEPREPRTIRVQCSNAFPWPNE